jgi:hypothetical protein
VRSTAPRWEQAIAVERIVTDDLVHFVCEQALEIEVWGAADDILGPSSPLPTSCGEPIDFTFDVGDATVRDQATALTTIFVDEDSDGGANEVEQLRGAVAKLKAQVEELKRESRLHDNLAVALIRSFDDAAASALVAKGGALGGKVSAAVKLATSRIADLQASNDVSRASALSSTTTVGSDGNLRRRSMFSSLGSFRGGLSSSQPLPLALNRIATPLRPLQSNLFSPLRRLSNSLSPIRSRHAVAAVVADSPSTATANEPDIELDIMAESALIRGAEGNVDEEAPEPSHGARWDDRQKLHHTSERGATPSAGSAVCVTS